MSKKIFLLINYSHETSGDVVAENIYELTSEEKAITKTSQLVNNGNGTSPYETVSGANLKYETKENAFNVYETKENAFNVYETQEYAAQTYETKVNVAIVHKDNPFSVVAFPGGQGANAIRSKRVYLGGSHGSSSGKGSFFAGFVTDYQLGLIGANGDYSNIIGSVDSDATGKHTFIGGGVGCLARSYSETAFGTYTTDYTPVSESENAPEDRLINIGNGTGPTERSDVWTLFKNGAQKWHPKELDTVTNAVKGFVAMDEDARAYTHDGIKWNKLALASEMKAVITLDGLSGSFDERLMQAIDLANDGAIIDATKASFDFEDFHICVSSVIVSKPIKIILPSNIITYKGFGNMFDIRSSNVEITGGGRSSRETLRIKTTNLLFENGNAGYHFYAKGQNVIKISNMDITGVRTTDYDAQQGSATKPLNGSGGIYIEKPNPGTTGGGNTVSNIILDNLLIFGTKVHGIYLDTPILGSIKDVRVSQGGGHGIFLNGGTSMRIENCYVSSTHKSGFCLSAHSYTTLISCASEYGGMGYWFRGCFNITAISCGAESNGNRSANVPNTNLTTFAEDGVTVVNISDVGGDNVGLFRGSSYVVTGGQGISLLNCASTNAGRPTGTGSSVNSRDILVRGNARNILITSPRTSVISGTTFPGRYNISFETFNGESPKGELVYNPETDGSVTPSTAGVYIASTNSASTAAPLLVQTGSDILVRAENKFFTPMQVKGKSKFDNIELTNLGNAVPVTMLLGVDANNQIVQTNASNKGIFNLYNSSATVNNNVGVTTLSSYGLSPIPQMADGDSIEAKYLIVGLTPSAKVQVIMMFAGSAIAQSLNMGVFDDVAIEVVVKITRVSSSIARTLTYFNGGFSNAYYFEKTGLNFNTSFPLELKTRDSADAANGHALKLVDINIIRK